MFEFVKKADSLPHGSIDVIAGKLTPVKTTPTKTHNALRTSSTSKLYDLIGASAKTCNTL